MCLSTNPKNPNWSYWAPTMFSDWLIYPHYSMRQMSLLLIFPLYRWGNWSLEGLKVKVKSLSHVRLFATPWIVAYQAPPIMGFSRQECWSAISLQKPERRTLTITVGWFWNTRVAQLYLLAALRTAGTKCCGWSFSLPFSGSKNQLFNECLLVIEKNASCSSGFPLLDLLLYFAQNSKVTPRAKARAVWPVIWKWTIPWLIIL